MTKTIVEIDGRVGRVCVVLDQVTALYKAPYTTDGDRKPVCIVQFVGGGTIDAIGTTHEVAEKLRFTLLVR